MNAEQYCEILEDGVDERFEALEMEEGKQYFQQDNNPKHTLNRQKSGLKTTIFMCQGGLYSHLT